MWGQNRLHCTLKVLRNYTTWFPLWLFTMDTHDSQISQLSTCGSSLTCMQQVATCLIRCPHQEECVGPNGAPSRRTSWQLGIDLTFQVESMIHMPRNFAESKNDRQKSDSWFEDFSGLGVVVVAVHWEAMDIPAKKSKTLNQLPARIARATRAAPARVVLPRDAAHLPRHTCRTNGLPFPSKNQKSREARVPSPLWPSNSSARVGSTWAPTGFPMWELSHSAVRIRTSEVGPPEWVFPIGSEQRS